MAMVDAFSRPFGGEHTPRSCMLASVGKVLYKTHQKRRVDKEMDDEMESRTPTFCW